MNESTDPVTEESQKPPPEYVLYAPTSGCSFENGNGGTYDCTLLGLSRDDARRMLTLRSLYAVLKEHLAGTYINNIYAIEAFDYSIEVGPAITSRFPGGEPHAPSDMVELDYDAWHRVPSTTEIHDRSKTSGCCILVLEDGVQWSFSNNYADAPQMLTPVLSWALLQSIVDGLDEFEKYVEEEDLTETSSGEKKEDET